MADERKPLNPLSPEEREKRKPPRPETLLDALHDSVHEEGPRKPVNVRRKKRDGK